jgi:hypothetical protein
MVEFKIDNIMLLGLGIDAAVELLFEQQIRKVSAPVPTTTTTTTIPITWGRPIIKPVTPDGFGGPHLKFILGDTPDYVLMDTGNPISHISLTKATADRIGITRFPKHNDGYIISPVNLPGVGTIPVLKAFVEDRGANLISPMRFTPFYDIEFSKEAVVFDPNRIPQPTIPYTHSPNPEVKPVINVNIGVRSANIALDSGADVNEITSQVANSCGVQNYPPVHVSIDESLGPKRRATYKEGYRVPVTIPGVYNGLKTFYISDIRESNLSLLSATQFLDEGWRLRYGEYGVSFLPPYPGPRNPLTVS